MANHRQGDDPVHEAKCWEAHHEADRRITILEVKTDNLKNSVESVLTKQADTNDRLNSLNVLFERFITKFESYIDHNNAKQSAHEVKLERFIGLDMKLNTIWSVVKIVAAVAVVFFAGMYTIQKDFNIISLTNVPHVQSNPTDIPQLK